MGCRRVFGNECEIHNENPIMKGWLASSSRRGIQLSSDLESKSVQMTDGFHGRSFSMADPVMDACHPGEIKIHRKKNQVCVCELMFRKLPICMYIISYQPFTVSSSITDVMGIMWYDYESFLLELYYSNFSRSVQWRGIKNITIWGAPT